MDSNDIANKGTLTIALKEGKFSAVSDILCNPLTVFLMSLFVLQSAKLGKFPSAFA